MGRLGSTRLAATFGAASLVVLLVAVFFLADTQGRQRADLRERYADRAAVASGLLDGLYRVNFAGQSTDLAVNFGDKVSTRVLDERVAQADIRWMAVVDSSGRVVGASSDAPQVELDALGSLRFVREALGPEGFGFGEPSNALLAQAVGFFGSDGERALVTVAPVSVLREFLQGVLQPLPGEDGARAVVLDARGVPIAQVGAETSVRRPMPQLRDALTRAPSGIYEGADGERFYASQPIAGSRWRLAITIPEDVLYATASGPTRWLPWVILALMALALAGITVLLHRLSTTSFALRRTNEELAGTNAELARSNSDLEQFASVASHDLSEPLRTVAGFSQLLGHRYKGKLDPEADVYIDHMADGVNRMQQLIDDLLTFSRVGREPVRAERVDMDEVFGNVLRLVEPAVRDRDAQITSDDLPAVAGEQVQLCQVLQNLLLNAMKFTEDGVRPVVHVGAERDGKLWRISVTDNGIGVPPEQREHIFKMFGRLHASDAYPGTGIGLALVERIVDRHGGKVWVEDAEGGGSRFCFTVPDAAAAISATGPALPEEVHA